MSRFKVIRPRRPIRYRAIAVAASVGAVAVTMSLLTTTIAPATPGGDGQARLQRDVNRVHDAGVVGVLADARANGQRFRARSGVADQQTGQPVPLDAQIRIGSATKTFVATVVLQLVAESRLSLEDTVARWLPGLVSGNGNDGREITVRQLLQMTSGLTNPSDADFPVDVSEAGYQAHRFDSYTPSQYVALAMRQPPAFRPGAGWNYANTNYVLAGMITEKVTGHSWQDEVINRIIVPLRLTDTLTPTNNPFIAGPHAHGYRQFTQAGHFVDTTDINPNIDGGASGGIISTTGDLAQFFTALVTGKLLRPTELAAMQHTVPVSPDYQKLFPGFGYGLGLMWFPLTCGGGYWTHWGDDLGFSTRGGVTPDGKRSVIVSTNSNGDYLAESDEKALHPLVDHALCAR